MRIFVFVTYFTFESFDKKKVPTLYKELLAVKNKRNKFNNLILEFPRDILLIYVCEIFL